MSLNKGTLSTCFSTQHITNLPASHTALQHFLFPHGEGGLYFLSTSQQRCSRLMELERKQDHSSTRLKEAGFYLIFHNLSSDPVG